MEAFKTSTLLRVPKILVNKVLMSLFHGSLSNCYRLTIGINMLLIIRNEFQLRISTKTPRMWRILNELYGRYLYFQKELNSLKQRLNIFEVYLLRPVQKFPTLNFLKLLPTFYKRNHTIKKKETNWAFSYLYI